MEAFLLGAVMFLSKRQVALVKGASYSASSDKDEWSSLAERLSRCFLSNGQGVESLVTCINLQ